VGAAHAHKHGCRSGAYGPFPFVVGALTVMGADLASWMRSSASIAELVSEGRASQAGLRHWDCGYSDVTLGYALAKSNLSVSLVSMRDAMRDATYGAMAARRFVVSHHLRTQKQFEAAHAEAISAAEWSARVEPCTAWPQVHVASSERAALKAREVDRRELAHAMSDFGCCQSWRVCEVTPESVGD